MSLGIYWWVQNYVPAGILQIIRLAQIYALLAATYLYLALLIGPLVYRWHSMPARGYVYRARRAIGVSAFYFACLHSYLAFFKQLGGFTGLGFLNGKYLLAISLSFTALVILALMASTSFDKAVQKLTFKGWKLLHRFIYLAATLVLIHALMLGTHFQDLFGLIPQISFVAVAFLLILQAQRLDAWLQTKFPALPRQAITAIVIISLLMIGFLFI